MITSWLPGSNLIGRLGGATIGNAGNRQEDLYCILDGSVNPTFDILLKLSKVSTFVQPRSPLRL